MKKTNTNFLDSDTPKVSDRDKKRLSPIIANLNRCNDFFRDNKVKELDIKKMLVLELQGKRRVVILDKLLARLNTHRRKDLQAWWRK